MQNNKVKIAYGKRSFPASAPLTWNHHYLATTVRDVYISMNSFNGRLKGELFRRAIYRTDLAPICDSIC